MATEELVRQILNPDPDNAGALLADLALTPPSREQVHREIEEKLLLPKNRLPEHWLSTYQVCARPLRVFTRIYSRLDTGDMRRPFQPY